METRPLVFSKEKSKIKSENPGFQQSHVPLYDPYSAAANEALFKLAKLNNVDGEEDHDGEPTGEVDEIYVPKPKKFLLAKSSNKLDVPSPIHINHGKANGKNKNFGMDEHTFQKTLVKDFEYLQSKGKLIPDNVKSAPIHVNNVSFEEMSLLKKVMVVPIIIIASSAIYSSNHARFLHPTRLVIPIVPR